MRSQNDAISSLFDTAAALFLVTRSSVAGSFVAVVHLLASRRALAVGVCSVLGGPLFMGGYIAADSKIIDVIRSYAPGFIFTTSLSPVLVAGVLASVRHLKASSVERDAQQVAAALLKQLFRDAGLPVMDSVTHIVPLMISDPVKAKQHYTRLIELVGKGGPRPELEQAKTFLAQR